MSCYQTYSLHAYNNAMSETDNLQESNVPWNAIYTEQTSYTPHNGVYGTIHNNNVVDVRPYEDDNTNNDEYNVEFRLIHCSVNKTFVSI
jgi:hypothetical protein